MFTPDGVTLRLALKAWEGAARQDAAYAFTSVVDGMMPDNAVGVSGMTKTATSSESGRLRRRSVIPEAACGYPGSSRTQRKRFGTTPDKRKRFPG